MNINNALATLQSDQFFEISSSSEKKIQQIQIYRYDKAVVLLKNGQELSVSSYFINFPKLKETELVHYLSQSHFVATELSDGSYKIDACLKLLGGGPNNKMRKIHIAARNGDISLLKDVLARKVPNRYSVDVVGNPNLEGGMTGLFGTPQGTEHLLRTALQFACESNGSANYVEIVDLLIKAGANINLDPKGQNDRPLALAMKKGNFEIAKKLIQAGADVYNCRIEIELGRMYEGKKVTRDLLQRTVLQFACDSDGSVHYEEIVDMLVKAGVDVNFSPQGEYLTPLVLAMNKKNVEIAKKLILGGADVNRKIQVKTEYSTLDKNATLLQFACREGNLELVQLMVEKGADVNATGSAGNYGIYRWGNPLEEVIKANYAGKFQIARILIKAKATGMVDHSEFNEWVCISGDNLEYLKLLVESGIKDQFLHKAIEHNNNKAIAYLLPCYNDFDSLDGRGFTPLALAFSHGNLAAATALLDKGADIAKVLPTVLAKLGPDAQYLLQTHKQKAAASRSMHTQMVYPTTMPQLPSSDLLNDACQRGDLNAVRSCGLQPDSKTLTFACISGKVEIVDLILSKGAKPDSETLTTACATNNPEIVEKMINCGAKPTKQTIEIAKQTKNFEIINMILTLMSQSF